jgi:hypothetical protein
MMGVINTNKGVNLCQLAVSFAAFSVSSEAGFPPHQKARSGDDRQTSGLHKSS